MFETRKSAEKFRYVTGLGNVAQVKAVLPLIVGNPTHSQISNVWENTMLAGDWSFPAGIAVHIQIMGASLVPRHCGEGGSVVAES